MADSYVYFDIEVAFIGLDAKLPVVHDCRLSRKELVRLVGHLSDRIELGEDEILKEEDILPFVSYDSFFSLVIDESDYMHFCLDYRPRNDCKICIVFEPEVQQLIAFRDGLQALLSS